MLFSEDLRIFIGELPDSIQDCLKEIQTYFCLESLTVLEYSTNLIAIPAKYFVSIPPLGTIGGIDIRESEPILILISLKNYPSSIPFILSDRKDFPKNTTAHIYASAIDAPAKLCLVRNNPNEWFAGKTIADLLAVGEQWFFKAATGQLTNDGEEFDPLRLERFTGYHAYNYEIVVEAINKNFKFNKDYEFAIFFSYINKYNYAKEPGITIKTLSTIPFSNAHSVINVIRESKKNQEAFPYALPAISLLVWHKDRIEQEYNTNLPRTYGELKQYFDNFHINIAEIIDFYVKNSFHIREEIIIIHAIRRPYKIIGYSGCYEFINFVIRAENFKEDNYPNSAIILNQSHIEPFSKSLAERLTGENREGRMLYIGAGSLGSKMIVHEARSGNLQINTIDDDKLLEHNLSRHALYQKMVGANKAEAITSEISDLYTVDTVKNFNGYAKNVTDLQEDFINDFEWVVDTTASLQAQNWLAKNLIKSMVNIARCELVDEGRLGVMYIEGQNRNPRTDDLINLAYYFATKDDVLRHWRERDAKREISNIDIGLGCSSTTTIMADDTISLHAAAFSRLLYSERNRANIKENGLIYISTLEVIGIPNLGSKHYRIKPFEVYPCQTGSNWEVRLFNGLSANLIELCRNNGATETGGVLVGVANYKTKTIHVLDIIEEPQDSYGTCTGFQRGTKGLPELINSIKKETGEVIGYIGEWHSHPMNLEKLSSVDEQTINKLIEINRKTPIPTCALIVTSNKVLPFVFE